MRATIFAVLLGLATAVVGTAADACSRAAPAQAAKTYVPTSGINQGLLDAAVRVETNYHRCRAGLPPLRSGGSRFLKETAGHSGWMARTHQLKHTGQTTLKQRVKRAGIRLRSGAENIGMVNRFMIDNRRFQIANSSNCHFVYNGQRVPQHTYATLARHIVDLWMRSPGHRKNILKRNVSVVSTAVAFDPNAQYCGRFWLTQAFVG